MSSTAARPERPPLLGGQVSIVPARPARRTLEATHVLALVLGAAAVYVAWHLGRGWIPHDEGSLGQAAERVLQGQLPHRDFDDVYTGGLAMLNAAAFRLFGTTLWTMRVVLFTVMLAWIPAVYYLASRFVGPLAAGAVTVLATVWAVPSYPAPMPSWYNLFLATFGVAALFRHLESGQRRWLVVAGLMGGLSFLVKVIGLYYVAGVLLYLVFRAHVESKAAAGAAPRRSVAYSSFVTVSLIAFVGVLAALVRQQLHASEIVHFVLPGELLAGLLVRNEWTVPAGDSRARVRTLVRLLAPFLLGVTVPVAIFLLPYASSNAIGALVYGVFVLPTKRFGFATVAAPALRTMLDVLPLAALVLGMRRIRGAGSRFETGALVIGGVALLAVTGPVGAAYRVVWYSVRNLIPLLVTAGVLVLARERRADADSPILRSQTMLLLSVTAVCSLVQFPFAIPIYFCYVAPLAALSAVALNAYLPPARSRVPAALVAFYIGFAVLRVNTSALWGMGTVYLPYPRTTPLAGPRAGIDVATFDAPVYNRLVPLLQARARGGYTWASPDCPEIYFLSGLQNPTRSLFEFFDEPSGRTARVLQALDSHGVTAVVLNRVPQFSPALADELIVQLEARYPFAANVGNFQLRWRE